MSVCSIYTWKVRFGLSVRSTGTASFRFRFSPVRRCESRSRKDAPTSCRSSSRTFRRCSLAQKLPLDVAAAAAVAARSARLLHAGHVGGRRARGRAVGAATSSPRSTSRCRARTATRWCPFDRDRPRSSTPTGRCTRTSPVQPTPVEEAIGEHVAPLVADGATLQMGIGAIPDAVLARLVRQARPRHPHRDVLRRRGRSGRGRRGHQPPQDTCTAAGS